MYVAMYYDDAVARMIRKQVYIESRQERLLKRRAKELGTTEADLIRQGIDLIGSERPAIPSRERALREFRAHLRERAALRTAQIARGWTREELHEERLSRYPR